MKFALTKKCCLYIYIYTNFIEHNRHFLSTYFLLDPFVLPYCFYRIRRELIYVLYIVVCIPSTFGPTLGHHQGRIYYKSNVTFVFAYYYNVRAFSFKWVSIIEINISNYPVEETYNAPFWYKFNSSAFKKTFMPNNTITENSHRQHINIKTSK